MARAVTTWTMVAGVLCVLACAACLTCGTLCSYNELGAEGAAALAPALGMLTQLQTLDLQ